MKSLFSGTLVLLLSSALVGQIVGAEHVADIRGEDYRARQLEKLQDTGVRGQDYRIAAIAAAQSLEKRKPEDKGNGQCFVRQTIISTNQNWMTDSI